MKGRIRCQERMTIRELSFILEVSPHNLMKVRPRETGFLCGVGDVSLVEIELVLDIPTTEFLHDLLLGLRIRQ